MALIPPLRDQPVALVCRLPLNSLITHERGEPTRKTSFQRCVARLRIGEHRKGQQDCGKADLARAILKFLDGDAGDGRAALVVRVARLAGAASKGRNVKRVCMNWNAAERCSRTHYRMSPRNAEVLRSQSVQIQNRKDRKQDTQEREGAEHCLNLE
jgi:hypothetical protein